MTWTRHQKQQKSWHSTYGKNTANGTTRLVVSDTADGPGECELELHSSLLPPQCSPAGGGGACESKEPRPFRPEMFKAKAHTGLTQDQQQQQPWRFPAQQERDCVGFYIYINHSFSLLKQAREQDTGNAIRRRTSTVHGRIIYCVYVWTANCECVCVTHTHSLTPVINEFMAKKVKLHLRARWAVRPNIPCFVP